MLINFLNIYLEKYFISKKENIEKKKKVLRFQPKIIKIMKFKIKFNDRWNYRGHMRRQDISSYVPSQDLWFRSRQFARYFPLKTLRTIAETPKIRKI